MRSRHSTTELHPLLHTNAPVRLLSIHLVADPFINKHLVSFFRCHTQGTTRAIPQGMFDGINETENGRNKQHLHQHYFVYIWTHGCIRKLPPSIGLYMQLRPISKARLATTHPTIHAHIVHKIVHILRKKKAYMHTPNNVLNHT